MHISRVILPRESTYTTGEGAFPGEGVMVANGALLPVTRATTLYEAECMLEAALIWAGGTCMSAGILWSDPENTVSTAAMSRPRPHTLTAIAVPI